MYFHDLEIEAKPLGIPYSREGDPKSHGFVDLRLHPEQVSLLPELRDCDALRQFVVALNTGSGPYQTLGCEKWIAPWSHPQVPGFTTRKGSYVDITFADKNAAHEQTAYATIISGYREYGDKRIPHIGVHTAFAMRPTVAIDGPTWWTLGFWNYGIGRNESEAEYWWVKGLDCFREFLLP